MRPRKVWVHLYRFLELRDRLLRLSSYGVNYTYNSVDDKRKRIQFLRPLYLGQCLIITAQGEQIFGIPVVRGCIVWIELNSPLVFFFAISEVPFVLQKYCPESRVRLGKRIIQLNRF